MITADYSQLLMPNLFVEGNSGFSLKYVQDAYNAPIEHPDAWHAWLATKYKHQTQDEDYELPNAFVPVFFRSITEGTNYGHVGIWDPYLKALHTTPYGGYGKIITTIEEIEKRSGGQSVCVGWSEDLNGSRIVRIPGKHAF